MYRTQPKKKAVKERRIHTHSHTHAHIHSHKHTHTNTNTHIHKHTHTHHHTHTNTHNAHTTARPQCLVDSSVRSFSEMNSVRVRLCNVYIHICRYTYLYTTYITSKACRLSLGPQTGKEHKRHPVQMPRLLLEGGICLDLRVSGSRRKVKARNGVIGMDRAGLETLRAL